MSAMKPDKQRTTTLTEFQYGSFVLEVNEEGQTKTCPAFSQIQFFYLFESVTFNHFN